MIRKFEQHTDLQLDIVGFGKLEGRLNACIHTDNIKMHGAVNNKELSNYYRQADVFILPSLTETWGLVVEEALSNGTPVMLSHMVGCADDLVIPGKTGVIFNLNDDLDFECRLREILDVDKYNDMRKYISTLDFLKRELKVVEAFIN